jgi:hypothetical protein
MQFQAHALVVTKGIHSQYASFSVSLHGSFSFSTKSFSFSMEAEKIGVED